MPSSSLPTQPLRLLPTFHTLLTPQGLLAELMPPHSWAGSWCELIVGSNTQPHWPI